MFDRPILVFDIETIPDVTTGRRLYGLHNLNDFDAMRAMQALRLQDNDNKIGTTFMKLPLHKIACISFLWIKLDEGKFTLKSLSLQNMDEKQMLQRFLLAFDKRPLVVSYNGKAFDMPVLMYRALHHGLCAPSAFADHKDGYLARYSKNHIDLIDVLSGVSYARQSLDVIAALCGYAGKQNMDGTQVIPLVESNEWQKLTTYCESDVLNTWFIFLHYQRLLGQLSHDDVHYIGCDTKTMLAALMDNEGRPRHAAFLQETQLAHDGDESNNNNNDGDSISTAPSHPSFDLGDSHSAHDMPMHGDD